MQLLNGREVAAFHRERVERRLADIQEELHIQPELAIPIPRNGRSCSTVRMDTGF